MTIDRHGDAGDPAGPDLLAPAADERPPPRAALAPVLTVVGLAFLVLGFSTAALSFVDEQVGFRRLVAAALGFAFLYLAALARSQARVRGRLLDLMEEVLKTFYGPNFRRDRKAIDILVKAMESDNPNVRRASAEHLRRLTGQDHGEDGAAWAAWWESARAGFRAPETPGSRTSREDG